MLLDLSLPSLQAILARRTAALDEPVELYEAAARELRQTSPARAELIERQCRGEPAEDLFEIYREAWDVPKFDDGLVVAEDFRNGFLFTFRDHTTSWAQDQIARLWFFTSPEAQFARRYELWSADSGQDECALSLEGSYRDLVRAVFSDGDGDLEALVSPAFSAREFDAWRKRLVEQDPELREVLLAIAVERGS